jgi:hypothetical protein
MKNETTTDVSKKYLEHINNMAAHLIDLDIVSGVSEETRQTELQALIESVRYQRFFFINDISSQSIIHPYGIKEWLGYDAFTLHFYPTIIHPNHVESLFFLIDPLFELMKNGKMILSFKEPKMTLDLAIRHADGHYILTRRVVSVWDFDANSGLPLSYINEFSILENYVEEYTPGIRPRLTDYHNNRINNIEEYIREITYNELEKNKIFTVQELRILRKYADNKDFESKDIASAFKISIKTVETHNKRIIAKYNDSFINYPLKSVKEIAWFLRREYFV